MVRSRFAQCPVHAGDDSANRDTATGGSEVNKPSTWPCFIEHDVHVRGIRPVVVDRFIYATITLMSVPIIYDGWQNVSLVDAVGVIVGPVATMFLAHVFSAAVAQQVEAGRNLTRRERI